MVTMSKDHDFAARRFYEDTVRIASDADSRTPDPITNWIDANQSVLERYQHVISLLWRPVQWLMPSLMRARQIGYIASAQEQGNFREALEYSLQRCADNRVKRPDTAANGHTDYWHFLSQAVDSARCLDDSTAWSRVWWEARQGLLPIEGFDAAHVMLLLSWWQETGRRREDAIWAARLALGADPTWAEPSIWAGKLGLRGAPFNAETMLRDAISIDSGALKRILQDAELAAATDLLFRIRRPRLRIVTRR